MTSAEARRLALALPQAVERDHHGMASFRVRGKIFATVPDERHLRVMADEGDILAAVAEDPAACSPLTWGGRVACVVVELALASPQLVEELLTDAWRRKAPRLLVREHDSAGS
ncbi:MAG: hypothetical protein QOJ63_3793 [Solirubrobacteraceae bacterium]|nr:hypothetical protein [Solirubrobacteraceae bacterium]